MIQRYTIQPVEGHQFTYTTEPKGEWVRFIELEAVLAELNLLRSKVREATLPVDAVFCPEHEVKYRCPMCDRSPDQALAKGDVIPW